MKAHFSLKNTSLLLTALFLCVQCASTKDKPQKGSAPEPILTLGSHKVPVSEFKYVYEKNNNSTQDAYSDESVREYLDLFTKFKLKVLDAESRGLDTTKAFKQELEGYKDQLAKPYLTEKNVTEKLIREAYDRMKEEVSASHLLIRVDADAAPVDTVAAYNKIMDLRKQIVSEGKDFEKMARQYSEDPSAASNSGKLGYFTSLQMVYPFEEAAFNTKVGDISMPVRTRFGYHLVKVNDRRSSQGQVKVAHIMVRAASGIPEQDSLAARNKIYEIRKQLQQNELSWKAAVEQFSEDDNSRLKEGELPPFGTGMMVPTFEKVAFSLANKGDVSQPVQTPYGWHIIKLMEKQQLDSFEDLKPQIKTRVERDSRSSQSKAVLISRLKKENNFKENQKVKDKVFAQIADSSLTKATFSYTKTNPLLKETIMTIGDRKYPVEQFYRYITQVQVKRTGAPVVVLQQMYDAFVTENLAIYEKEHLSEKYEDYRMLLKEYRDGILLFQLMDQEVWTKAMKDSAGLETYYENNKNKYRWKERAKATIYNAADASTLAQAKSALEAGGFAMDEPLIRDMVFETGKTEINQEAKQSLDLAAALMSQDPTYSLKLTAPQSNLFTKRFETIKEYLTSKNVKENQVEFISQGKSKKGDNTIEAELYGTSAKALERKFNRIAPLSVQVTNGLFQKSENPIVDKTSRQPGSYTVNLEDGRMALVIIEEVQPPRNKKLEEARGMVISDYQNYLEEEWLKELRSRYPVSVNEEAIKKIVQ